MKSFKIFLALVIFLTACKARDFDPQSYSGRDVGLTETPTLTFTQKARPSLTPSPDEVAIGNFGADVDNDSTITPSPTPTLTSTLASDLAVTATLTNPAAIIPTAALTMTPPIQEIVVVTSTSYLTTTWPYTEILVSRSGKLNQAAWLSTGERVAVSSSTGLFLIDAQTSNVAQSFNLGQAVQSVTVDPFWGTLVYGGMNGSLQWRDPLNGKFIKTFQAHYLGITDLSFTSNGFYLVSGGDDGTIRYWNAESVSSPLTQSHQPMYVWNLGNRVTSLDSSRDGLFVAGGSYQKVLVWDTAVGEMVQPIEGLTNWVAEVAFSPIQDYLAFADGSSHLQIWDTAIWTKTHDIPIEQVKRINALAFRPDGALAFGDSEGGIYLWDIAGNKVYLPGNQFPEPVVDLAFSPNGDRLVVVYEHKIIRLWSLNP